MQKKKQGISLIFLVLTVISTYNETTKNRKVPPKNTIQTITKIIYNKEAVRNILADSLYNKTCEGSIKRYNKMSNFAMES